MMSLCPCRHGVLPFSSSTLISSATSRAALFAASVTLSSSFPGSMLLMLGALDSRRFAALNMPDSVKEGLLLIVEEVSPELLPELLRFMREVAEAAAAVAEAAAAAASPFQAAMLIILVLATTCASEERYPKASSTTPLRLLGPTNLQGVYKEQGDNEKVGWASGVWGRVELGLVLQG